MGEYRFIFIFLLFLGLGFCGEEEEDDFGISIFIERIPVSGVILEEEIREVRLLGIALRELGLTISSRAIFFVRDPYSEIPSICRGEGCSNNCAGRWIDLPEVIGVLPTTPLEGYKGFMSDRYFFISRLPSAFSSLRSLLIHEYSHSFNLVHGEEMEIVERIIGNKIIEIEERENI
jgi:hypothetical protein